MPGIKRTPNENEKSMKSIEMKNMSGIKYACPQMKRMPGIRQQMLQKILEKQGTRQK